MSSPFDSARRKVTRAKKHFNDLKGQINAFFGPDLHETFSEPHPEKVGFIVHKLRLTRELPNEFSEIVGDVVANLRSALDHAVYAVAVASGCAKPRNAYFPFSKTAKEFEPNLKGRCADVPKELFPFFRRCKPYHGGDQALWTLHVLRSTSEHAILVPAATVAFVGGMNISATGGWSMPNRPVWDRVKNEMELFMLAPGATFKGEFRLGFYVAFGEIEGISGENAAEVIEVLFKVVEHVIGGIEAEARRAGIVK